MAKLTTKEIQDYIDKVGMLAQKEALARKNSNRNWSLPA